MLTIDGQSTDGWDGDRAAKILRGKSGSSVNVRFARRTEQMPGVAGRPEEPLRRVRLDPDSYQYRQVCGRAVCAGAVLNSQCLSFPGLVVCLVMPKWAAGRCEAFEWCQS